MISAPILEIQADIKRMKALDRTASLPIHSQDVGSAFSSSRSTTSMHISLEVIDNLEQQKQKSEVGADEGGIPYRELHELKTPLASLKIILENMRDKIMLQGPGPLSVSSHDRQDEPDRPEICPCPLSELAGDRWISWIRS